MSTTEPLLEYLGFTPKNPQATDTRDFVAIKEADGEKQLDKKIWEAYCWGVLGKEQPVPGGTIPTTREIRHALGFFSPTHTIDTQENRDEVEKFSPWNNICLKPNFNNN